MSNTDKYAVEKCIEWLNGNDYENIKKSNHPTDIEADKDGVHYYIEVKMTLTNKSVYFGAASITEWVTLRENEKLIFIVAISNNGTNDENTIFSFQEYDPDSFLTVATVPPFKINFNLPLYDNLANKKRRQNRSAVHPDSELVSSLSRLHSLLRDTDKRERIIEFIKSL